MTSDILGDGRVFLRQQLARHATTFSTMRYKSPWSRKDNLFSRTILRWRYDHSMVGPSPATHSCTSIIIFKVYISTQQDGFTSTIWCSKVNNNSQQVLLSCCFFDHVSRKINEVWLRLCYLYVALTNLLHRRDSTSQSPRRWTLYICRSSHSLSMLEETWSSNLLLF